MSFKNQNSSRLKYLFFVTINLIISLQFFKMVDRPHTTLLIRFKPSDLIYRISARRGACVLAL